MRTGAILEVTGLTYRYPRAPKGSAPALGLVNVGFTGGITALVGPNGAGKTTLLRCLATAAAPERGTIRWRGAVVNGSDGRVSWESCRGYRQRLGYVPQQARAYPEMTPRQFLTYLAALKLIPETERRERVALVIGLMGLAGESDRPVGQLSSGQVRRLILAQALLNDPEVLLIDETAPTLDPEEQVLFRQTLRAIPGTPIVVLSTHLASELEAIADRVVLLDRGRVVADLPVSEFLVSPGRPGRRLPFEQAYKARLAAYRAAPTPSGESGQLI